MSTKKLTTPFTDNSLSPIIKWHEDSKFCLVFKRSCLKQKNATYTPSNRINFFVYEFDTWSRDLNSNLTLKDCLFGGVKSSKNADPDKYICIMVLVLDSVCVQNFHCLTVAWVKMSLFLELI